MDSSNTVQVISGSTSEIVRAVSAEMLANNPAFAARIPELTQENLRDFGTAVLSYQPAQNEFIDTLVNLIGRVWITSRMFQNPLRALKKGKLEFGDTIESVYANVATAHQFDPAQAETEWMKRVIPDVSTAFSKRNYQLFYKATISEEQLRSAFLGWSQMQTFINNVFQSMYNGAEVDEFAAMKELLENYGDAGKFAVVPITAITSSDTARAALAKIKGVSNKMAFMRSDYNSLGVITCTPKNMQVLIIDADFDALLDVEAYATLFNLEPARAQYRKIVIDDFPTNLKANGVRAVLIDEDFYSCWDNLTKFTKDYNGQGLYWQYWAHFWRILAVLPFANAVAFTDAATSITNVTVTPSSQSSAKGSTVQMSAAVTGTGAFSKNVAWSVSGNSDASTVITPLGELTIGSSETGPLTVTATSVQDSSKTGTSTITVT